jgi:protein-disulfide isomerase
VDDEKGLLGKMNEAPNRQPRWRVALDAASSLSLVVLCAIVSWSVLRGAPIVISPLGSQGPMRRAPDSKARDAALPSQPLRLDGANTRGSRLAPVAIVEYSDFLCPYCSAFARDTFPRLDKEYLSTGKALLVFRHLPLEGLHPLARAAAEAADCAGRQSKFWDLHDLLFRNQTQLTPQVIRDYGHSLDLDKAAFDKCLSGEAAADVRADAHSAGTLGVDGTPTFFVGKLSGDQIQVTARLKGAASFDRFQAELNRLMPVQTSANTR